MKDLATITRCSYMYAHRNLKSIEISGSEHTIIMYLAGHDGANQETISQTFMLDKGTIAKAVAKLEEKGFLERSVNPNNKREKLVSLTEYGRSAINAIIATSSKWEEEALAGLTKDESRLFVELCERVAANAKRMSQNGF